MSITFVFVLLSFIFLIKTFLRMKTFKKSFKVNTEPSDIYSAITNPFTIELWSGYPAIMSTEPGSEFSLWEGDITGINLEFVQDRKLVQEWYFGDQAEKSIVTINITPDKENSIIAVEHTNIPDEEFDDISEGWREFYVGAIKNFFNPNF
jgi:activator of HSP90 ATPase